MKHALLHYTLYSPDDWRYRHVWASDYPKAWYVRCYRFWPGRWISKDARYERVEFVD